MKRRWTLIWAGRALALVMAGLSAAHVIVPNGPVGGSMLAAAIWMILLGKGASDTF